VALVDAPKSGEGDRAAPERIDVAGGRLKSPAPPLIPLPGAFAMLGECAVGCAPPLLVWGMRKCGMRAIDSKGGASEASQVSGSYG